MQNNIWRKFFWDGVNTLTAKMTNTAVALAGLAGAFVIEETSGAGGRAYLVFRVNSASRAGITADASGNLAIVAPTVAFINAAANLTFALLNGANLRLGDGVTPSENLDVKGNVTWDVGGRLKWRAGNTQATVGAAGAATALPAQPTGYAMINVGGTDFVVPYYVK